MKKSLLAVIIGASLLSACSSVPMESKESTNSAKEFNLPATDTAGIYIYRKDSLVGAALKKDVWVNGQCVGETAPGVFFYYEAAGNKKQIISTESEFSANDLPLTTENGELYFVEQYIKMGAFSGGAGLKQVENEKGRQEVLKLKLAKKGKCSTAR